MVEYQADLTVRVRGLMYTVVNINFLRVLKLQFTSIRSNLQFSPVLLTCVGSLGKEDRLVRSCSAPAANLNAAVDCLHIAAAGDL